MIGKETAAELAQAIETLRGEVNNIASIKEFGISKADWEKNILTAIFLKEIFGFKISNN